MTMISSPRIAVLDTRPIPSLARSRTRTVFLSLLLFLAGFPTIPFASDIDKKIDGAEMSVSSARAVCQGILLEIRSIQKEFPRENLDGPSREEARRRLWRVSLLAARFEKLFGEAKIRVEECRKEAGEDDSTEAEEKRRRIGEAKDRLEKYGEYVRKFYNRRAIADYGKPLPPSPGIASSFGVTPTPGAAPGAGRVHVAGELRTALGRSSYERPHAEPDPWKESGTYFEGHGEAKTRLRTGTVLDFRIGRESRVERREISLSEVGVGLDHSFSSGLRLSAGFSRRGYDEEVDENNGFGETRWTTGVAYRVGEGSLTASLEKRSRSHSNDDPYQRDYGVAVYQAKGRVKLAGGELEALLSHVQRRAETAGSDFRILHPAVTWRIGSKGTELHGSIERFSNPDNDSGDNDRIKAHFLFGYGSRAAGGKIGPEVVVYRLPNQKDAGYGDYGFTGDRAHGDRAGRGSSRWRLFFRRFEADSAFHLASLSWRSTGHPRGSGWMNDWGLTGTAYVERADYDSLDDVPGDPTVAEVSDALGGVVQAFQATRPPHSIDTYLRVGRLWRLPGGVIRTIEVAPSLGHRMFLDDERSRLQDMANDLAAEYPDSLGIENPLGNEDYLFHNSINRARWGIRFRSEAVPLPLARISASVQYDQDILYNAEPAVSIRSFDLRVRGEFRFTPAIVAEGWIETHRSRVGENDSSDDFDRTEVVVRLRYLFDAMPGG